MDLINLEKKFASIELRLSEIESKLSKAKEQLIADSEVLASPKVDSHLIQSPVSSSNEVIEKNLEIG